MVRTITSLHIITFTLHKNGPKLQEMYLKNPFEFHDFVNLYMIKIRVQYRNILHPRSVKMFFCLETIEQLEAIVIYTN